MRHPLSTKNGPRDSTESVSSRAKGMADMRSSMRWFAGSVLVAAFGCGGTSAPLEVSSSRPSTGTPDPSPPLARSYYRIVPNGDAAALVPRPDDELARACTANDDLTAVAQRYQLCNVDPSGADFVARINRLSMADALAVKRALECRLRFAAHAETDASGKILVIAVWPDPSSDDVWTLCTKPGRSGLGVELCAYHSPEHHTLEARYFGSEDNLVLASRLNALYGIDDRSGSVTCRSAAAP